MRIQSKGGERRKRRKGRGGKGGRFPLAPPLDLPLLKAEN